MPFDTTAVAIVEDYDTPDGDLLRRARKLIENPDRWCQGTWGEVRPSGGMSLCAVGATHVAGAGMNGARVYRLLNDEAKSMGYLSVADLNDRAGHATVMLMFDRAIAAAAPAR